VVLWFCGDFDGTSRQPAYKEAAACTCAAVCTDLYNFLWSRELLSHHPTAAPDQPSTSQCSHTKQGLRLILGEL
jgi:hypothetical protein